MIELNDSIKLSDDEMEEQRTKHIFAELLKMPVCKARIEKLALEIMLEETE